MNINNFLKYISLRFIISYKYYWLAVFNIQNDEGESVTWIAKWLCFYDKVNYCIVL